MKRKGKKKPEFFVIHNAFGRVIVFENIFEFSQMGVVLKGLKKLKKRLDAAYGKDPDKYRQIVDTVVWAERKRKRKYTVDELVEMELRHKCQYYFWAKCEYEVVVTGWPDTGVEKKIDVYTQLDNNWEIFRNLVFELIK